jgi:hypothetical protein
MKPGLLAFLLLLPLPALGCGICIEDRIASCYDHAVVMRAKSSGQAVAFFGIGGDIVRSAETRRRVERAILALPGVQAGTQRISLENAALSFAYDPARAAPEALARELARRLADRRLSVQVLKTL